MSLTKKDKEEIKRLIATTLDETREGKKYIEQCNEEYDLELQVKNWNENAIDTKLGFYIAPENLKIEDKEHFTWDEAKEYEKKLEDTGWRLPTVGEWVQMYGKYGIDENGKDAPDNLMKSLSLPLAGDYYNGSYYYGGSYGFFWSSTAYDTTNAYYLHFCSTFVYPQSYFNKSAYGFNVRMIKDKKEE